MKVKYEQDKRKGWVAVNQRVLTNLSLKNKISPRAIQDGIYVYMYGRDTNLFLKTLKSLKADLVISDIVVNESALYDCWAYKSHKNWSNNTKTYLKKLQVQVKKNKPVPKSVMVQKKLDYTVDEIVNAIESKIAGFRYLTF